MISRFLSALMLFSCLGMVNAWGITSRGEDGILQKLGRSVAFRQKVQEIQNHKEVHVLLMDENRDYWNDVPQVQLEVLMDQKEPIPITFYHRGKKHEHLQELINALEHTLRPLADLPISAEGELEPYLKASGGSGVFVKYWGFGDKRNTFSPWGPHPFKITPGCVLSFQGSFYGGPVEGFMNFLGNRP